jgi:hypothetical protein
MLDIKQVKRLKERSEDFVKSTLSHLSQKADKDINKNLDNIALGIEGLNRVIDLLQIIKKYLNNPEPYLEAEIEEYLL